MKKKITKKSLEHFYASPRQKEREEAGLPPIRIAWAETLERYGEDIAPPPPTPLSPFAGLSELSYSSDSII